MLLIDREACIPVPPAGHRWKEVRHDNTVTWLVSWTENIQGSIKYIMLNANSKLKVQKMYFFGISVCKEAGDILGPLQMDSKSHLIKKKIS